MLKEIALRDTKGEYKSLYVGLSPISHCRRDFVYVLPSEEENGNERGRQKTGTSRKERKLQQVVKLRGNSFILPSAHFS